MIYAKLYVQDKKN